MQKEKELRIAEEFEKTFFKIEENYEKTLFFKTAGERSVPTDELIKELLKTWKDFVEYVINDSDGVVSFNGNSPLWNINNWVWKINELLGKEKMYEELITFSEDVLKLEWKNPDGTIDTFMYENARRTIADAYAVLDDYEKAIELYESYLEKDELWGLGWLGYCWVLEEYDEGICRQVVKYLRERISKEEFRDKDKLLEWLNRVD